MTANLRMAPPHLYRTYRLVQAGRSHVQQSAPSHHITLDSDGLIHAQLQEQFTLALTASPHPTGVNRARDALGPLLQWFPGAGLAGWTGGSCA